MPIALKKPFAILAVIGAGLSAHAVPNLELQETPPLKPLHSCQDSQGQVKEQIEDCGPGQTEVSSITSMGADGKAVRAKLGTTLETPATPAEPVAQATPSASAASTNDAISDKATLRRGQKSVLKLLAFALAFGLIAKLMQRSFWRWALVGALVSVGLVAANVMSA